MLILNKDGANYYERSAKAAKRKKAMDKQYIPKHVREREARRLAKERENGSGD